MSNNFHIWYYLKDFTVFNLKQNKFTLPSELIHYIYNYVITNEFKISMNKNNLILYIGILTFGIAAPFLFPAFKVQLSILCVLIILATTWNIQGGEMGYNSFGNILFYGLGMYLCASVQVGMFFPLAEWTESGGEKTFVHTPIQFFQKYKLLFGCA